MPHDVVKVKEEVLRYRGKPKVDSQGNQIMVMTERIRTREIDLLLAGYVFTQSSQPSSIQGALRRAAPRQVQWVPIVPTVLPSAQLTTLRARNSDARGLDHQHQTAITLDNDQNDAPALRLCSNRRCHRGSPSKATLSRSGRHRKRLDIPVIKTPGESTRRYRTHLRSSRPDRSAPRQSVVRAESRYSTCWPKFAATECASKAE
jgi:hypothetical protein